MTLNASFTFARGSSFPYNGTMLKGLKIPILIFLFALAVSSVVFGNYQIEYGTVDFFKEHGIFFLIVISFFPRLTLLFSSVPFGGVLWWLGFFFMPRLLVAILATFKYLNTNPLLVGLAWFVAISGEILEKKKLSGTKNGFVFRTYRGNPFGQQQQQAYEEPKTTVIDKNGVIEAEFTKKD